MNVKIQNLTEMKIEGVQYCTRKDCTPYLETYFDWTAYPLVSTYQTPEVVIGILTAWHHTPTFDQVEIHEDYETFFFVSGSALMLFCDLENGKPVMETAQIARIEAGTEIVVAPGKAHFVPVGISDVFQAVVVSPRQEAPRTDLPETICGI